MLSKTAVGAEHPGLTAEDIHESLLYAAEAVRDEAVLEQAHASEQVLIPADTDFGGLLSRSRASSPSVILIRGLVGRRAAEQATIILANLGQVTEDLTPAR
jgi:predicted nuclease of predicted toxin-antitoxin system